MPKTKNRSIHVKKMHGFNASHEVQELLAEVNRRIFRATVGVYAVTVMLFMLCAARFRWNRAWMACWKRIGLSCAT